MLLLCAKCLHFLTQLESVCRETDPNWDLDIGNDVKDEGEKFGPVVHHYVDKNSKVCPSSAPPPLPALCLAPECSCGSVRLLLA